MQSRSALAMVALHSALMAACGGDSTSGPDAAASGADAAADAAPGDYARLIGRTWSLAAGQPDTYRCVRITVPQDVYITSFRAQAPLGTHHTVLSVRDGEPGTDGEYDCTVGSLDMHMLYASGVGTATFDLPADVGIRVRAGQQLNLNLHLFNASDEPLSGDSGILVKAQSTPPAQLAEMIFAGTFAIEVPAGATRTVSGGCAIPPGANQSLFAYWPHMHQYAVHQKLEVRRGGNTNVLHDAPFAFAEQNYYPKMPPVQLQGGDQVRVSCTYNNTSGSTIHFGDSSNQEMCFSGLYLYPARGAGIFDCASN